METDDTILEFICLPTKHSKILKPTWKVLQLIIKGRTKLCQLSRMDPFEILVSNTNAEIMTCV